MCRVRPRAARAFLLLTYAVASSPASSRLVSMMVGPTPPEPACRQQAHSTLVVQRVMAITGQSPTQPHATSSDLAGLASMATPLGRHGASRDSSGPAAIN